MFSESSCSLAASSATVIIFLGRWLAVQYVPKQWLISILLFHRAFIKDHKLKKIPAETLVFKVSL